MFCGFGEIKTVCVLLERVCFLLSEKENELQASAFCGKKKKTHSLYIYETSVSL